MRTKCHTKQTPSGTSLVELLVAAAILVVGLVGVIAMLIGSSAVSRNGAGAMNAAAYAGSALQDLSAMDYCSLTPLVAADAGVVFDSAGRRYGRIVNSVNSGPPMIYTLTVQVDWSDANKTPKTTTMSSIVSRRPDAGC